MIMKPEGGPPPSHHMTSSITEPIHRQLGMTMTIEEGRPPSNPPPTT